MKIEEVKYSRYFTFLKVEKIVESYMKGKINDNVIQKTKNNKTIDQINAEVIYIYKKN